jgi:D-serine deaminase-like pyridoxal phosphate-dependent protein
VAPTWEGDVVNLDELETPAVAIDLDAVERNVRSMATHARRHNVALRPHAKTHKMREIASLQLREGAVGLTLAKLGEVEALLSDELADVLVAYPVLGAGKLDRLLSLARQLSVTVSLDNAEVAMQIGEAAQAASQTIAILIEIDTGGRRCGALPGEPAIALAKQVDSIPGVDLRGIMTHEGHVYGARDPDELRSLSLAAGKLMVETAEAIRAAGLEAPIVSVGSSPSARHIAEVAGVTEIRPGTYVFYDYNHVRLGVASVADCAATVLATVVARPAPDRAVIDAGTKAVAADRHMIQVEADGYGMIKGQPGWFFARASEEHGVLLRQDAAAADLKIGQRLEVIPNHICPAINLYDEAHAHRGGQVEDTLQVVARGRSR